MKYLIALALVCCSIAVYSQSTLPLRKKDRKKDIEMRTTLGTIVLRLSDSTPLHRDNFLRLVKQHYYDSILFHRVIETFMIQAGDPKSKNALPNVALGNGGPSYTIPAEFRPGLFHRRGTLAAAREGDARNPQRASSASQFYIVQGRTFTDSELDSVERVRLRGYRLPEAHREVYRTIGGTPQLDQNYTVFGEVIEGMDVVDQIAHQPTSKSADKDRPLTDIRILTARLVKRKRHRH